MPHENKKTRFDYFKSIFKTSILTLSILVIVISTISGSINANARQQEILNQELFYNPQAILNVTFKDNVYLDNIIDNELNSDKNWQGLTFDNSNFGITSLSGLSNIGGVEEMVSINGQYSTKTLKKSYKDKLQELIVKIDDIKNNKSFLGEAGADTTERVNAAITTGLAKMNNWEVKKQRYYNWSQSKILNISLLGNSDALITLESILLKSGHTKSVEYTNMTDLLSKLDVLKKDIDSELKLNNLPIQSEFKNSELKDDQINKVFSILNSSSQALIDSELIMSIEGKRQIEKIKNQQDLINSGSVKLDDKDYEAIDKILPIDKDGNKIIDNKILSQLENFNFTEQEKTLIKLQINLFNEMPTYIKNNIQSELQQLESKTSTIESSLTKVEKFAGGLANGIISNADWCRWEHKLENKWWGFRLTMNNCMIKDLNQMTNTLSALIGVLAGYCGFLSMGACSLISGTVAGIIAYAGGTLSWLSDQCGGTGAIIKRLHSGVTWFFRNC
jgi:hypothetical protein